MSEKSLLLQSAHLKSYKSYNAVPYHEYEVEKDFHDYDSNENTNIEVKNQAAGNNLISKIKSGPGASNANIMQIIVETGGETVVREKEEKKGFCTPLIMIMIVSTVGMLVVMMLLVVLYQKRNNPQLNQ